MTRTISWMLVLPLLMLSACSGPKDSAPALGEQKASLNETPLVIDDFSTGFESLSLVSGNPPSTLQAGSMLGDVREITFAVDSGPLQQTSSYTMNGAGGLVISSGLKSFWGMYLIYGYDMNHNFGSVDLDLSPYDAFCLDFGSNDQVVSGGVQVYKDGAIATAPLWVGESNTPFSVNVPYTEFASTTGEPLPWDHVFVVLVLLQVGSPNAGNDLELKSIKLGACGFPLLPPQ